ncbi:MAG: hypothetical protein JO323_19775 [Acidobacteriia bacterium]|nr:hypothetical protein [Terriglobia bacterium]
MAQGAPAKFSRRGWLLAGIAIPLFRARATPSLNVTFDGDDLHVLAPELHFLTGKPLARLKDADTVVFVSQLTLFDFRHAPLRRAPERLTISYDLWEEKFKVVLAIDRRSVEGLSAAQAEAWCVDKLAISALGIDPFRPFWLRLELRTANPREISSVAGDTGISIRGLIELFGRKAGADESRWTLDAGPLRLADLPRKPGFRTRNE